MSAPAEKNRALHETARQIVADHKGILAADESTGTIAKRFDSIGVDSTEEYRRFYRGLLFTAPGMEEYVGGVILYDETIRQSADDGTPFADVLAAKGVIPGIKVDTGAHDQAGFTGEKITEGLDGLRARLEEYRGLGARFAKWRAVITIGEGIPSVACIRANAHALARYAALCQEAGIVPIVEPEVLMDADNTIERCYDVTARTLKWTFHELVVQGVDLKGILLKPNMVISGKGCPEQASSERIARADDRLLPHSRTGSRAGDRLPVRRPVRGAGDREPERDQPAGRPVGSVVLVRTRAPAVRAPGVGRGARQSRRRAGCVPAPRAHERAGCRRGVVGGTGAAGRRLDRQTHRPWSRTPIPSRSISSGR